MGLHEDLFPNMPKEKFYREMWASLLTWMVMGLVIGFIAASIKNIIFHSWDWYLTLVPCVVATAIWIILVVGAYILGWIRGAKEDDETH